MGIPLDEWSGAAATRALHDAIAKHQDVSTRQVDSMIRLTLAIAVLTVVMLFGLGIQIYLGFYPPH